MTTMTRYQGKPFLRFLDSYVLDAIGQLTDDQRQGLDALTPMLAKALGIDGSWQDIVTVQMEFPPSMPEAICRVWSGYLAAARASNSSVDPNTFVAEFVGRNFPDIAAPSLEVQ